MSPLAVIFFCGTPTNRKISVCLSTLNLERSGEIDVLSHEAKIIAGCVALCWAVHEKYDTVLRDNGVSRKAIISKVNYATRVKV